MRNSAAQQDVSTPMNSIGRFDAALRPFETRCGVLKTPLNQPFTLLALSTVQYHHPSPVLRPTDLKLYTITMERGGLLSRSERSYIPLEDLDSPPQSGQRYSHTEPSPSFPLRPGMDEITSPELGRSTSPDLTKEVLEYRGRPLSRQSMTPSTMSRTHIHRYTWWFEFLSLVTSAAAIVATFAILRLFDRKPIPHWATAGSGLSLNSILSVFSTMSRASLLVPIDRSIGQLYWLAIARRGRRLAEAEMYNQASRGPHGAIRLLWKRRGM